MPFEEELLIIIVISLGLGFALGFFYVKAQITAIENSYRAELEKWKLEAASEIRKDSVNRRYPLGWFTGRL